MHNSKTKNTAVNRETRQQNKRKEKKNNKAKETLQKVQKHSRKAKTQQQIWKHDSKYINMTSHKTQQYEMKTFLLLIG